MLYLVETLPQYLARQTTTSTLKQQLESYLIEARPADNIQKDEFDNATEDFMIFSYLQKIREFIELL